MDTEALQAVFARQLRLQTESYGVDPAELDGNDRADYILMMAYALIDETGEALDEVKWKGWSKNRGDVNFDRYKAELVDAFHFFVNLCLAGGVTADDLVDGYFEKAETNARRQQTEGGYDAHAAGRKCPNCQAELDKLGATFTDGDRILLSNPPAFQMTTKCVECGYVLETSTTMNPLT